MCRWTTYTLFWLEERFCVREGRCDGNAGAVGSSECKVAQKTQLTGIDEEPIRIAITVTFVRPNNHGGNTAELA
jgi:hypothetical protein